MKCDFTLAQEELALTSETILPCLPEIFIDERRGEYLALNPLGPWWFIGAKLHADFVRLCDGKRTLQDIREVLSGSYDGLTDERMISVAKSLHKANFFTPTEKREMRPLSVVFFNITKRCNLRCPYCYYDSVPVKCEADEEELDTATWIELAGKIAAINPRAIIRVKMNIGDLQKTIGGTTIYIIIVVVIIDGLRSSRTASNEEEEREYYKGAC